MNILIAGEEHALSLFLKRGLEMDGYGVQCLHNVAEVLAAAGSSQVIDPDEPNQNPPNQDLLIPDLLILDHPPGLETPDILSHLRSINEELPILALIAGRDVESRVGCLDRGADDCMIKPISLQELRARCRALLRRRAGTSLLLRWEGVELDRLSRTVVHDGRAVPLTRTEFLVLEYLMMHRGSCISRDALLARVWAPGGPAASNPAASNIVDVYINYLRRKLGTARGAPLIQTVRGRGYRLGGRRGAVPS